MKRTFNCTQQELYTICLLGWNSCLEFLSFFTAFNAKYIGAYVTSRKTEVEAAKLLPDDMQRKEAAKLEHIALVEKGKACTNFFMRLKRYIVNSYDESQHETMFESAGQAYYTKAATNNWDAVEGLNNSAITFITAHDMALGEGGMPPAFAGDYGTAKMEFAVLHQNFLNSEETAKVQTVQKLTADNAIHAKLMDMFADAQLALPDNEAILDQFNFSKLLLLVSGAGTAGLRGLVTNAATGAAVANATITLGPDDYSAVTDAEGRYEISPAAAGVYTGEVVAAGFAPLPFTHEILTGTISTVDFELV